MNKTMQAVAYPEDYPTEAAIRDGSAIRPYRPTISDGFLSERHKSFSTALLQPGSVAFAYPVSGKLRREDALKLYEMAYLADGDCLELGTYKGLSSSIMGEALRDAGKPHKVYTADLNPDFVEAARAAYRKLKLENVVTNVMEGGAYIHLCAERGMMFSFAFIDHWHGYDATVEACVALPSVLKKGGFVLFHDFTHAGNVSDNANYDVVRAVKDALSADFRFYGIFGCCALYRFGE